MAMIDLQYHKGQKCITGSTFCQEGYCSGCAIHLSQLTNDYEVPAEKTPQIVAKETNRDRLRQGTMQPL